MRSARALLLVWVAIISGCGSTAAVGDGEGAVFRWLTGELEASSPSPVDRVTAATLRAFEDLGLVAVDNAVYGSEGKVTGRMADGTKVRVKVQPHENGGTRLAIRIGEIGDEPISRQLLRHIEAEVEK